MYYTRESIFVGAIRSFCVCFAAIFGIILAITFITLGFSFFSNNVELPEKATVIISPDANGKRDLLPSSAPVILRINFHGIIGQGDLTAEKIQNILLDSREDLFDNNRVKGIILHMNTPGGMASDADSIYCALMKYKAQYKIPIYAYVDDISASGGVYISSAADRIYSSPISVVGSVGALIGPAFNFSKTMEFLGIQSLTLSEGKDKDMLNPFRPWVPGEDQSLRNIVSALYERFVSIVVASRPNIDREKLVNEYGAQVFYASKAQEIGFIDVANSDFNTALADLVKAAGIPDNEQYQVIQLQPVRSFLLEFTESSCALLKGKMTHVIQIGPEQNSELCGKFLYLYQPSSSFGN